MSSHHEPANKPNPSRYRLLRPAKPVHTRNANAPDPIGGETMDPRLSACLKVCQDCAGACLTTITHCLGLAGEHAEHSHQAILQDCADICETTARFIARRSAHSTHLCRACAELCAICARDCDSFPGDDQTMRECAQSCRLCVECCQGMTADTGEG